MKYMVEFEVTGFGYASVTVEADELEEAIKIAKDEVSSPKVEWESIEYSAYEVTHVK